MGILKIWDGTTWQLVPQSSIGTSATFVGPNAPPGTPVAGDLWYDTDDPNTLLLPIRVIDGGTGATDGATARANLGVPTFPLSIPNGGTGAADAPSARSGLAVPAIGNSTSIAGAPTGGAWVRGDHWLDVNNVLWVCTAAGTPGTWMSTNRGEELAYNQITTSTVSVATGSGNQTLVVEGTSRSYDGSPVFVEFSAGAVQPPTTSGSQMVFNLWDAGTDIGYIADLQVSAPQLGLSVYTKRRVTPTPGTHNYRIAGWVTGGTGSVFGGSGVAGQWDPIYVRVTRA
jgi:hypothetical protein